jgi:hypothetical protein
MLSGLRANAFSVNSRRKIDEQPAGTTDEAAFSAMQKRRMD